MPIRHHLAMIQEEHLGFLPNLTFKEKVLREHLNNEGASCFFSLLASAVHKGPSLGVHLQGQCPAGEFVCGE